MPNSVVLQHGLRPDSIPTFDLAPGASPNYWTLDGTASEKNKRVYKLHACSESFESESITVTAKDVSKTDIKADSIPFPVPKVRGLGACEGRVCVEVVKLVDDPVVGRITPAAKCYITWIYDKGYWSNEELNNLQRDVFSAIPYTTDSVTVPDGEGSTTTITGTVADITGLCTGGINILPTGT